MLFGAPAGLLTPAGSAYSDVTLCCGGTLDFSWTVRSFARQLKYVRIDQLSLGDEHTLHDAGSLCHCTCCWRMYMMSANTTRSSYATWKGMLWQMLLQYQTLTPWYSYPDSIF